MTKQRRGGFQGLAPLHVVRDRFKVPADRPMSAMELMAIRKLLCNDLGGLSQDTFAAVLGYHVRAYREWENGNVAVPTLVAREARRLKAIAEGRIPARLIDEAA